MNKINDITFEYFLLRKYMYATQVCNSNVHNKDAKILCK